MSDESRNVLVVTFEDSAESVKVCVCVCVCVVCVCVCASVHVCVFIRAYMCVCVWWVWVWVWVHTCMRVYVERVENLCSYLVHSHVWEAVKGFG